MATCLRCTRVQKLTAKKGFRCRFCGWMRTLFLGLFLLATPHARAQVTPVTPLTALGYCQITVLTSAVTLAGGGCTVPALANAVYLSPETQAVRYRDDGTAPTAAIGMTIASGATLFYSGPITNLQFIQAAATAKLNVLFYQMR